jgi:SAM-dependent methyltransferase
MNASKYLSPGRRDDMHTEYDYRESHLDSGPSYAAFFEQSPRLQVLTNIETGFLEEIFAKELAGRREARRALDFACGTGRVLSWLETKVPHVVGVDISASMLDLARQRIRSAELVCADLTSTPNAVPESFDVITALRFFPNAQQSLREQVITLLASRLNDDGIIIFNNHIRAESLNERLRKLMRRLRGRPNPVGMGRTMSDTEVRSLLSVAGLREIRRFHCGVMPVAHGWLPMPVGMYAWSERRLAEADWARRYAQYHLIVCEKRKP